MMMTSTHRTIVNKLRKLDELHWNDGDGGYGLVNSIVAYHQTLSEADRIELRDYLLCLVRDEDRTMRGAALESLVQLWGKDVAPSFASLLDNHSMTDDWVAQILLATLRLGYAPLKDKALSFIERNLTVENRTYLPWLAALSQVDAQQCIRLASSYFAISCRSGSLRNIEGYVPAFVINFAEIDPTLLATLIASIAEEDDEAARETAKLFVSYLQQPFVAKQFGTTVANELVRHAMTTEAK